MSSRSTPGCKPLPRKVGRRTGGEETGCACRPAMTTRNMSVLARSEAIIGGERFKWVRTEALPGVWDGTAFQLGDFKHLARFLATKARIGDVTA